MSLDKHEIGRGVAGRISHASSVFVALRKPDATRYLLLVGFLLPLALDVRKINGSGESALQILLVAVTILCGSLYFVLELLSADRRSYRSSVSLAALAWWVYIAVSPIPVVYWDVDIEHYLKVLLPFVLFGVGLTVMAAVERRQVDPAVVLDILVWCALVSTIWRAFYAIAVGGLSLDTVRWQILGPAIPFAVGYGAAGLYLGRRRTVSILALTAAGVCVLLSITRSYLITGAFVVAGLLIVDARRRSGVRAASSAIGLVAVLLPLAGAALAVTAVARPNFAGVWIARLFQHSGGGGLDVTLMTRVAEVQGQLTAWLQSPVTLLMGNGIGADYIWDRNILRTLAVDVGESTGWFAGHFTWVYSFFASGLVFGVVVPLVLGLTLIRGFSAASKLRLSRRSDEVVLAFAIYLAYLGQSFTAHMMYERYGAMILGIVSGAILIYQRQLTAEPLLSIPGRQLGVSQSHPTP